ncbi:MAG: adenosylmethionine decarboxylase [Bacteroidota bacterium]
MKYLGKHYLLELYDCPPDLLSEFEPIGAIMNQAALEMRATIVNSNFHHFNPYGVSGVIVIKESHLTIHTWPEYGYAAVDVFTCGAIDIDKGIDYLKQHLKAGSSELKQLGRGREDKFNAGIEPKAT